MTSDDTVSSSQHSDWLNNPWLFLLGIALSVLFIWQVEYLPLLDLPQHAAQVTALKELAAGNPLFVNEFEINWFTPYLLGTGAFYVLSLLMPLTTAAKLYCTVAVAGIPLMTWALLKETGADTRWKWLAIPSGLSYAFYLGFLSYILAAPLAMGLLWLSIRYSRKPTVRSGLLIAVYALFLFFCHIVAMGFGCMVSLAWLLGKYYKDFKKLVLVCLPYVAPVPLIFIWTLIIYRTDTHAVESVLNFNAPDVKLYMFQQQLSGLDGSSDMLGWVITPLLLLLPWLAGCRWAKNPWRWAPFAAALFAFAVLPEGAFGSAFLYQRLGLFLIPMYLLAWNAPEGAGRGWVKWVVPVVISLLAVFNIARFDAYNDEAQGFVELMAEMEPGKRTAGLIEEQDSQFIGTPPFLHFGSWYQAEKAGISDFNFAFFYPVMVRYKQGVVANFDQIISWYPYDFDFDLHYGDDYDYFVIRSEQDLGLYFLRGHLEKYRKVKHVGMWSLWARTEVAEQ